MQVDLKQIAPLVKRQFPAFYQEEGPNFIQFIKAYYEWMDSQGPTFESRRLLETIDIDETADEFVDNFISKYMHGIPRNILSDKRLLEKHILDVYRSKGSIEGLKLLFRLLYNVEASIFIPKVDVLRTSDGKWQRKQYMEVETRDSNASYDRKNIRGSTSGATAFVTNAVKINTGVSVTDVFYVTDVYPGPTGSSFLVDEYLLFEGLNIKDATKIIGSAVGGLAIESSEDFQGGDILSSNSTTGEGLRFEVATLKDATQLQGYIDFKIVDGGYGYAVNSDVTVVYGTASQGTGATFKVGSISNTVNFTYNINIIGDYSSTALNAGNYGTGLKNASLGSVIDNALTNATIPIGTIASLSGVTSGDHKYNGSVVPTVFERRVAGYGFMRSDGTIWGNNAIITGKLAVGNGVINSVRLLSSGFGYNTQGEELLFTNEANTQLTSTMQVQLGAIGLEEGTWVDNSGLLNSDKYITDSNYYQDFSYEIQLEKSLDKYINVLKQVMHPVGNRVFGKPVIIDTNQLDVVTVVDIININ
jgi:hypothetical protein